MYPKMAKDSLDYTLMIHRPQLPASQTDDGDVCGWDSGGAPWWA